MSFIKIAGLLLFISLIIHASSAAIDARSPYVSGNVSAGIGTVPASPAVSSGDGLKLKLGGNGNIEGISINGTSLPMLAAQGGFSFREVLTNAPNLIANPGFEDGAGKPFNWSFVTTNGNTPLWDNISKSGARAIKISISGISDNKSGYPKSDMVTAEPLQYYTFSAWVKADGAGGKNAPAVRVVELDSNRKWLTQTNLIIGKGTYDWTQKKLTFRTGINTSYLYVYANIWDGYGTFWLDDVELAPFFGPTISLNGALTQNPDGMVTQRARQNDIDFTFYYIPKDRYIELQGEMQDRRGEDRALQG